MIKTKEKKKAQKAGLKEILKKFRKTTVNPEIYLSIQVEKAGVFRNLLKSLYDHGKKLEENNEITSALPELILDDMDEEQIWQQLELQNEEVLKQKIEKTSNLLSLRENRLLLNFNIPGEQENASENEEMKQDDQEDVYNEEELEKIEKPKKKSKKTAKNSEVDDEFFKLDEMSRFLDEEDKKEMRKTSGKQERNALIEIDYFDGDFSDDDSEEEDEGKNVKYAGFFDDEGDEEQVEGEEDEDDENEMEGEEDEENNEKNEEEMEEDLEVDVEANRKARMQLWNNPETFIPEKNENRNRYKVKPVEEEEKEEEEKPKSSFELRQEKLQQKISKMEDQILKEKPWQLKGEISASTRPQNSLLEEVLEFDSTTRPVPVITEETTMKLEDIIKQRIRDKAFDDVERKIKPPDNPREYRKQLVLDSEKSKESLAQIYEKDYLKQLEKNNPDAEDKEEEEPVEHKEIRNIMKKLLHKLDALSNYHYTPRPAVPDIKIITNTPAINMEEVAPIAVSDVALLAPEEVKSRPKGDVMSKDERTKTDKNRERRSKKLFQKDKQKREVEKEQTRAEKGIQPRSKDMQKKLLEKVTKSKNVDKMSVNDASGKSFKSSTAFFSQLQDEVSTQIKSKTKAATRNSKDKKAIQATHVKL